MGFFFNIKFKKLLNKIWIRLIPDATMRGQEIPKLDRLSPVEFKSTVLQMVATRDDTAWKRIIRNKPKLALYTIVCELEQHNEPGRKTMVSKQYLKRQPHSAEALEIQPEGRSS